MPTMTNPETGETKEISMEEFMKAMQDGEVTVRQEVHHADGTVTSSAIFGNNIGDGVDRSLNVFGAMEDVLYPVIYGAKKSENGKEISFCADNSDVDYEVTVDDTQIAMMHVIRCTKKDVTVARYVRDERKTVGKPSLEKTFKFVNGKIIATVEQMKKDQMLFFVFGIYELRKLLAQRGQLQELKKLANRGSGVIVTRKGEEVITKIVCGKERPDLPCMMFGGLFAKGMEDAVMVRPYMDELMNPLLTRSGRNTAKSKSGPVKDPKLERARKLFASDDETKIKEAVSILENLEGDEAKRLLTKCNEKIENLNKLKEEEKKKQQEKDAKEKTKIENYIQKQKSRINNLNGKIETARKKAQEKDKKDNKNIEELKKELGSLGFFAFGAKCSLKKEISVLEQGIIDRSAELRDYEEKTNNEKECAENILKMISSKPGDEVEFGTQFYSSKSIPMKWLVSDNKNGIITMLAKHTVARIRPFEMDVYDSFNENKNYWISKLFPGRVFDEKEKAALEKHEKNGYRIVVLPTEDDVKKATKSMETTPEESFENNDEFFDDYQACHYWLDSFGLGDNRVQRALYVDPRGNVNEIKGTSFYPYGVRPLIRVNIERLCRNSK